MDTSALAAETSTADLSALMLATVGLVLLAILLPLLVILIRFTRPLKRRQQSPLRDEDANRESSEDAWVESGRRMKPDPDSDEGTLPTDGEFG